VRLSGASVDLTRAGRAADNAARVSDSTPLKPALDRGVSRRSFLRWGATVGGGAAAAGAGWRRLRAAAPADPPPSSGITVVPGGCAHNCGGHCVLKAWVKDGRIIRITTDDRPDSPGDPQLRACPRGRAYRRRVYHRDRLRQPLKRVGERGEGRFAPVSWDEAAQLVADAMRRVRDEHGPAAFFNIYATGGSSLFAGSQMSARLLNLFGGRLGYYNSYSSACARWATPYSLGIDDTGHSADDYVNSKLILLWGFNPVETIFGTNTGYRLKLAREAGARIVVIDPRLTMSAQSLADEWIPIRAGTDNALMDAMAYVMLTEELHDQAFLDRYCVGFDEEHLPPAATPGSSYKSYVLGQSDGTPKTPEWAERFTLIPRATIARLARDYARTKPAALLAGLAYNRRAYGEQPVRGSITLAAMTGNVGISGGSPGGVSYSVGRPLPVGRFPAGHNSVPEAIPAFKWTDAVVRGTEMGAPDGVRNLPEGQRTLGTNIKFIFNTAGNTLVNQHANINRTHRILRDPKLLDFIVVTDQFLTPSARYADVLLPAVTWFEHNDICTIWDQGASLIFMNQAIAPMHQCKSDYDIFTLVATKLGIAQEFTEGKTDLQWLEEMTRPSQAADPGFPGFDEFRRRGVHIFKYDKPHVPFADFRGDPDAHPLKTPSGKIEIYSSRLADMRIEQLPPIPKYIPEWEGGPWDPLFAKYPLQAIGSHYHRRVHSTHDNVDWLEEAMPQRVYMNVVDAKARGIGEGDEVRVVNDRGELRGRARLTRRIIPGLVDIPQGAWWTPDKNGVDRRGSVNVLTSERATPGARGNAQHTMLVQVEKV
jgi:anaerobic dimethyl sulfoxide reductase subunit A